MAQSGGCYQGNFIFRNQPNHSYFDKPFKDPQDCFYLSLNEIHPHFLRPEQLADKRGFEIKTITDPRTQKPVTKLSFDHTREAIIQMFRCPKYSNMSRQQHMTAVNVLQALQNEEEVEEEKMYNWYSMNAARARERSEFHKFVYEFNQTNKELIYKPAKKILDLYRKWYMEKFQSLIVKYPAESYNTHLGLPQVRLCKDVLNNQTVSVENQELVTKMGQQCIWQEDEEKMDFTNLNYSMNAYMNEYINSQDLKDNLEDDIKIKFHEKFLQESTDWPVFYIPLESLLFLLNAGDYADISTEMLLNIKEDDLLEGDAKKTLIMDTPLPSRQAGWHIYNQVIEQTATAFLSMKNKQTWINYNSNEEEINNEDDIPEIKSNLNNSINFKVSTIDNYLENYKCTPTKNCKFSKSLIKWQLNPSANDTGFQIYTSLQQTALIKTKDSQKESPLGSVSIKLEYKPQFGCEIMTKYEMLEEWFKLKLLQASKSICLRLDVNNFRTLLKESLTLQKLEQNLKNHYQIDIEQLLTNLYEFLKIMLNMPTGHYMLRYNPKFKDKLMLCKPSKELTQNTIHLHQLINTPPTDLLFKSQQNFLPISENLCSLMHFQNKCIPCAFRPGQLPPQKQQHKTKKTKKQPTKKLNDKDWILKRVEKQKHAEQQKTIQARIKSKKLQRTRRRIRRDIASRQGQIQENTDDKEVEHEMALDFKMLGT